MQRSLFSALLNWKQKMTHKPLILRGARQVGKTHLVRQLGKTFEHFIEINFEKDNDIKQIFDKGLAPQNIIRDLQLITNDEIIAGNTLLFFDEIQEAPNAIKALRYFYEDMPELHVIAAGSLLDFALEQTGVPVGRVEFLHLHPLSFLEFLDAYNAKMLTDEILQHPPENILISPIHDKLQNLLGIYLAVGGMPEAVQCWINTENLAQCNGIQQQLIGAYAQDFEKYAKKLQIKYLDLLFHSIPQHLGNQFKYSNIATEYRARELAPALDLLVKARIVHKITHSSGNGVPLGAEANLDKFKPLFLDIALSQVLLGLETKEWILNAKQAVINKGKIAEAFVGQELLAYSDPSIAPKLYYWQREKRGSNAEVDYLYASKNLVIPIEVKSNEGRSLKSLHIFLEQHPASPFGVRFSAHNYSLHDKIKSYPLYAVGGFVKQITQE